MHKGDRVDGHGRRAWAFAWPEPTFEANRVRCTRGYGISLLVLSGLIVGIASGSAESVAEPPAVAASEARNAGASAPEAAKPSDASLFWSFQPLRPTEPPTVKDAAWCRTLADRFVLRKLEEKGIRPNPIADRRTLIRRAYFDLIGLPPAPEDVARFLADESVDAYERLIDRLLENPHFGERWARHWLDLARFAESHGYEQDYDRPNAYHYRDFVIQAFNRDLPYDQFVKWQIAGDEIEPENPLAMMATGFLAAGTHATQITANQAEKERYDELDDMARTIGTTMLGLTIGCARCHDHKFDPISTAEYYRLISTFSTTVRSDLDVNMDPDGYKRAKAAYDADHAPLVAAREKFERDELPQRFDQWHRERLPRTRDYSWIVLEPAESKSEGGATFTKQPDGSLLVTGKNPDHDVYTFVVPTQVKEIRAIRLEALAHSSLVKSGPGRASNGNFGLTHFQVIAEPLDGSSPAARVPLTRPRATFDQSGLPVSHAIDDNKSSCWAVDPEFGRDHAAVFATESPVGFEGGTRLTITLEFKCNKQHAIGRPRLSIASGSEPESFDAPQIPESIFRILAALEQNPDSLDKDQRAALLDWYRPLDEQWRQLNDRVAAHAKLEPQPQLSKMLVSSEGVPAVRLHTQGLDFYDPTYILKRGDLSQKGEVARQGFLQVLMRSPNGVEHWRQSPPDGWRTSYRRRNLAAWLTDVDYGAGHLLARVIVNRLWQHHLGRGIVGTPSDFGQQGERPTHPELLDWLAAELIRNGWRLKPIHKLIMTSATYMQTAETDEVRLAADRDNSLFWHRPRRRLEAEIIRDATLAVSGSLDPTMFGPGTLDPKQRRRSIYYFVKRSKLIPMMALFDAPDSLVDIAHRPTTTVAPQALMLMNNEAMRELAGQFAARITRLTQEPPEAVRTGYSIALARLPTDEELADSVEFLRQQTESYHADGKPNAGDLALGDFCQALISLNEFVYVE